MGNRNRNRIRKKPLKRSSSPSTAAAVAFFLKNYSKRSSSSATERRMKVSEIKRMVIGDGKPRRFTRPFQIGCYSQGSEPDRIPYHLYLLVKEAVDLMNSSSSSLDLIEKKIAFFCDFFYSHLPPGWKYDRNNATSLVAECDAFFAKGGPKYHISGYAPLGYPVDNEFDYKIGLRANHVFEIMNIVHSRKTPTPETFMDWDEVYISFYCKLCSCFGLDYQHLEAASEDDVVLMDMGPRRRRRDSQIAAAAAASSSSSNKRGVRTISSNKDNDMFKQHMRKLSSNDEAFALSGKEIRAIVPLIRKRKLPPQTTFTQWNEFQISFYCKMCSCFGLAYHQLREAASSA